NLLSDDGKRYGSTPGICDICVHTPINTGGLNSEDAESLKNRVYNIINDTLVLHERSKSAEK
ncbi:MAG: 1-acyl-sn-glycerol-3-phosphate acyltransferase, partial [Pedobacter sp.]